MKYFLLPLTIFLTSCNMDVNDQHWQKGNLHTHSFWSDGDDFPEMIIDWYKENDYQFIALSDHNTIANDDDYWYRLKQSDLKNKTFEKYKKSIAAIMFVSPFGFPIDINYLNNII